MQPGRHLFPEFESAVDTMLADWQSDSDRAIAEMEPEPSLEEWLSTAGTENPADRRE